MAFARSWDETQPDGSEAASDIDLEIRKVKEDVRERLEDITTFGTDADPLELDQSAVESKAPVFWGSYDDGQSAGNKVTSEGRGKIVAIDVTAQTDSNGVVTIDLGEFSEALDITVSHLLHVAAFSTGGSNGTVAQPSSSGASDVIGVTFYDNAGTAVASTDVTFVVVVVVA